jgi:hypothetical protein
LCTFQIFLSKKRPNLILGKKMERLTVYKQIKQKCDYFNSITREINDCGINLITDIKLIIVDYLRPFFCHVNIKRVSSTNLNWWDSVWVDGSGDLHIKPMTNGQHFSYNIRNIYADGGLCNGKVESGTRFFVYPFPILKNIDTYDIVQLKLTRLRQFQWSTQIQHNRNTISVGSHLLQDADPPTEKNNNTKNPKYLHMTVDDLYVTASHVSAYIYTLPKYVDRQKITAHNLHGREEKKYVINLDNMFDKITSVSVCLVKDGSEVLFLSNMESYVECIQLIKDKFGKICGHKTLLSKDIIIDVNTTSTERAISIAPIDHTNFVILLCQSSCKSLSLMYLVHILTGEKTLIHESTLENLYNESYSIMYSSYYQRLFLIDTYDKSISSMPLPDFVFISD